MSDECKISAIVCTYNRSDLLKKCLDALEDQTLSKNEYEVIIVNNRSTDDTQSVAEKYVKANENFFLLKEIKQGLAVSRNTGLKNARSEIAAFTDDDAIPQENWLELLLRRFEKLEDNFAVVGGEIDQIWEVERPRWLTDKLLHPLSSTLGWSEIPRELNSETEWLCEVNSAYKIKALMDSGGFPEDLGRIGNNLLSGENAVNKIMAYKGWKFFFDPEIRVRHLIPKDRVSKSWFKRRYFWQGVTEYYSLQYLKKMGYPSHHSKNHFSSFYSKKVHVPVNKEAWLTIFDKKEGEDFEEGLKHLFGLGMVLASEEVIIGR